jgi:hypothetical protein
MKTLARREDGTEIRQRLKGIRPDSLRRWGRMSAHQMLCHLNDSFRLGLGEKAARDASTLLHRTVVKWIALRAPLRWPPGIRTRPEVDPQNQGTQPVDFVSDLAALQATLDRFCAEPGRLEGRRHPLFGCMPAGDWLRWGYLHADHHLRQFGG